MLAHLTRKRFLRGNARTGELEYEDSALRWSGAQADGDEFQSPVEVVIEVGGRFVINSNNKLVRLGQEWEYTPARLYQCAAAQQFGFVLLYDEKHELQRAYEEDQDNDGHPRESAHHP